MADHNIVLIVLLRHLRLDKASMSVRIQKRKLCQELIPSVLSGLLQLTAGTVSQGNLNQDQKLRRFELGGCFTTAAVRQQSNMKVM